jgi:cellulose synthase/poly-beta-1,6-N-acetylglucosamine synthase-like glycosyltransferase
MIGFYVLALLVIIQGVAALLAGVRYLRFIRQSLDQPPTNYTPKVAVFAPCKGLDPGFRESIQSLLGQNYPDYEVIFVTESRTDPAYHQIWRLLQEENHPHARLIEAGPTRGRGQKVHNLLGALDHVSDDVEVFAFVDSDATPPSSWLRSLVAPLADREIGATTGYRWYLPAKGNWGSRLRSMWNAGIATALGPHRRNFTWGGSTAIRRQTFEAAGVHQRWLGACTEDYPLGKAVKDQGLYVKFVPQCLIPSRGGCDLKELLQFTTRQMVLTRVYSPHLWWLALVTNVLFFGAFYGGVGIVLWRLWAGLSQGLAPICVGLVYLPGVIKSGLRQKAVELILTDAKPDLKRYRLSYWFLYPLANLVFVYNLAFSAVSRRIEWRGIRYELVSPNETLILEQD